MYTHFNLQGLGVMKEPPTPASTTGCGNKRLDTCSKQYSACASLAVTGPFKWRSVADSDHPELGAQLEQ